MRRVVSVTLFVLISFFSISLCAQDAQKALDYLNVINDQQVAISQTLWDYTCTAGQGKSARRIENKRKELLKSMQKAKTVVQKMDAYDGSTQFRDSAVAYFELSYDVINRDYEKIVDMQEISEQSYDAMEAYLLAQQLANEKLDIASDIFKIEYEHFAAANNITLLDDKSKLALKLEKASDVYKYYNPIYLTFFKSYKQEMYLTEAVNKKDINAIEQNKQTLLKYSEEGLASIKSTDNYKEDASLKKALEKNLQFYMDEVEKMDVIVSFFVKSEAMEAAKKSFDAKKNKLQEDVDAYNLAIDNMNKAVADYNKTNQGLNNDRADLLAEWNKTCSKFTRRHIPKR